MKHYTFTCFGVGVYDHLWYFYRMELFEKVTLNSIVQQEGLQDNCEFTWCIFLDKEIPKIFYKKLMDMTSDYDFIEFHFLEKYSDRGAMAKDIVLSRVGEGEVVIQTRIDDDDAIHVKSFMEIRKAIANEVSENRLFGVVGLAGGFDYLCEIAECVRNDSNNLALGLTVFFTANDYFGVFDYSHSNIFESFSKKKGCGAVLIDGGGWYLYSKHSLSDSNYFGMRHRFVNRSDKFCPSREFWNDFGLIESDVEFLSSAFLNSPVGLPKQAIKMGVGFDKKQEPEAKSLKRLSMSNILRPRAPEKGVVIKCFGDTAGQVGDIFETLHSGFSSKLSSGHQIILESIEGRFDFLIFDDVYIENYIEEYGESQFLSDLKKAQFFCDYVFLINVSGKSGVKGVSLNNIECNLDKSVLVGGLGVDKSDPEGYEAYKKSVFKQICLNVY